MHEHYEDHLNKETKMSYELKVKALSLAEECRVNKREQARELRLQRRYAASQYRVRLLEQARLAAEAEGEEAEHESMINADRAANTAWQRYLGLRDHNRRFVKPTARATNIARGFLKGLPYGAIETFPNNIGNQQATYLLSSKNVHSWVGPDWRRVVAMVEKYGDDEQIKRLPAWLAENGLALDIEGNVVLG